MSAVVTQGRRSAGIATFLTWNFERRSPGSRQADVMMERALAERPDAVCLTEAFAGSTTQLGGHEIADRGASWSNARHDSERLVVLWSPEPWRDVDAGGNDGAAKGGYISGVTDTPLGPIRVVGICAPHHFAAPPDAPQRPRLWTEQIAFWGGLAALVKRRDHAMPVVLLGDYNQYVPRIWGSRAAHDALVSALDDLRVVTAGPIKGIGEPTIDHICHSPDLTAQHVKGLSRFDENGAALSDHFGVVVRLKAGARDSP